MNVGVSGGGKHFCYDISFAAYTSILIKLCENVSSGM
jgi:hypothetical protein